MPRWSESLNSFLRGGDLKAFPLDEYVPVDGTLDSGWQLVEGGIVTVDFDATPNGLSGSSCVVKLYAAAADADPDWQPSDVLPPDEDGELRWASDVFPTEPDPQRHSGSLLYGFRWYRVVVEIEHDADVLGAVAASVVLAAPTDDGGLEVTAVTPGADGNDISIIVAHPGADNSPFSLMVDGLDIQIAVATDNDGADHQAGVVSDVGVASGTWDLTLHAEFEGIAPRTITGLAWDISAGALQTAIRALGSPFTTVLVTGASFNVGYEIAFAGAAGKQDVDVTVDDTNIVGGNVTAGITVQGVKQSVLTTANEVIAAIAADEDAAALVVADVFGGDGSEAVGTFQTAVFLEDGVDAAGFTLAVTGTMKGGVA